MEFSPESRRDVGESQPSHKPATREIGNLRGKQPSEEVPPGASLSEDRLPNSSSLHPNFSAMDGAKPSRPDTNFQMSLEK